MDNIEINPASQAIASIIWLHGLGADGHDFVPIASELNLPDTVPIRFVFPHAPMRPVTINNGMVMRAWYDILSMDIDQRADEAGLFSSVELLKNLIQEEIKRGTPAEKIILAGFSQGAAVALTTTLLYPHRLAGLIVLSGYLPFAERTLEQSTPANHDIPIFMAHGTHDPVVPFHLGQLMFNQLHSSYPNILWHSYPMQHSVCMEEIHDVSQWIQQVVN